MNHFFNFIQSPIEALQSLPEGAYAAYPPDVTEVRNKPPTGGHEHTGSDKTKPEHSHVTKQNDLNQNQERSKPKAVPELALNVSPRKSTQDVKPKGKTTPLTKQNVTELDANKNRQPVEQTSATIEVKPNPIAKLDLGRFSRGPGKADKKSDRQNGNIVGPSKIPTKPGGVTSPSDTQKHGPGQVKGAVQGGGAGQPGKGQGASPSKMPKHVNSHRLDKIRAVHAQGAKGRMAHQQQSGGGAVKSPGTPSGASGSIIAQAIAATSQDRQAKLPGAGGATRPDTLLKAGSGHLPAAAPAMPDLLPESVLKVGFLFKI